MSKVNTCIEKRSSFLPNKIHPYFLQVVQSSLVVFHPKKVTISQSPSLLHYDLHAMSSHSTFSLPMFISFLSLFPKNQTNKLEISYSDPFHFLFKSTHDNIEKTNKDQYQFRISLFTFKITYVKTNCLYPS